MLDDDRTLNAFALPGGQVFVTHAMVTRLETEERIRTLIEEQGQRRGG